MDGETKVKVIKKIWRIFINCLTIVFGLLAIFFIGTRILGYKPYTVLSSSMNPAYKVGDLVFAKKVEFSDVKVGDALVFKTNGQVTVTHRVTKINTTDKSFITRGDANKIDDSKPVYYDNIVGVVKFSIPKLGYISIIVMKIGIIPVVMIMVAIILCYEVLKRIIILKEESKVEENNEKEKF